MLEAMLHVAARFSGCGETGVTPCHAATRGAEELQTDLTSVEMLNHKVMRRWQAPALYGSQKPTLTTSNLVCLPCSITTRNVTSVEAGWSPSTPPRTFLGQRNSCAQCAAIPPSTAILQASMAFSDSDSQQKFPLHIFRDLVPNEGKLWYASKQLHENLLQEGKQWKSLPSCEQKRKTVG